MKYTIPQLIAQTVERHGERPALHLQTRRGLDTLTYEVLANRVESLARWIAAQGGRPGDRVALIAANGPDFVVAALAVIQAGRVLVPLDMQFTPDEVLSLVDHSEAVALIVSRHYQYLDQLRDHPGLSQWPLEDLIADVMRLRGIAGPLPASEPGAMAILLYTSGTSGAPKGVPMTHHNITSNVIAVSDRLGPRPTDVWLSLLPLSHGLELCMGLLAPLINGAAICYPRSRRPDQIIAAMEQSKTTVMITVPAILDFFAKSIRSKAPKGWRSKVIGWALRSLPPSLRRHVVARLSGMPVGRIRGIVCGGAFLLPDLEDIWRRLGLPIIQGYGLTEAGPVVSVNIVGRPTRQSAGPLLPIAQVKIDNPDKDGIGEILVKSPGVMSGYYKNPEATAATFTRDGWLKTGDLGHFNERGELCVAGRSKDVIITGNGLNVYPEEIEAKLEEHPLVRKACVVQAPITTGGRRAERDGDQVWAVVVLDEEKIQEHDPDLMHDAKKVGDLLGHILADANARLAPYKRPAGMEIWTELPITRSGKVQRQRVRQTLQERAVARAA
ncbi:MAG: AMP-binding protein [Candidatus Sumerlaeia bacterium]|nr:AMP-binding protein [Candidatus Sumerlaeia bacterium]